MLCSAICTRHRHSINTHNLAAVKLLKVCKLLPVLAANPIKYSSLFLRINLKSWRYAPNLGRISNFPLTGNSIDRPKYITFCHS